ISKEQEPDVDSVVAEFTDKTRGATIHRAHFLDELSQLAPSSQTEFGKKLVDVIAPKGDEDGSMTLHFRDRTFAEADKLVSLVPGDASTRGWPIWEMPPALTYVKDRVVMLGDAAHASTPFAGSGAAMATEDSCVLHTLLGKYLDPERMARNKFSRTQSIRLALQSFDSVRRLRSQKVVVRSAEMCRLLSCTEEGASMSQDEMNRNLDGKLRWIYDGDQEEQVRDVCMLFERAEFAAAQNASR
ncbi:hypothetical protein GQ44DRAFT_625943, partial [Phaeosphaeriaceae sp. PMI808]